MSTVGRQMSLGRDIIAAVALELRLRGAATLPAQTLCVLSSPLRTQNRACGRLYLKCYQYVVKEIRRCESLELSLVMMMAPRSSAAWTQ